MGPNHHEMMLPLLCVRLPASQGLAREQKRESPAGWGRWGWERTGKVSQSSPGWRTSLSWHVGLSVCAPVPGALCARVFSTRRQRGHCRHIHHPLHPRLPPPGELSLQRNAALHSSHLNGARDHSPVRSLQFLAEPIAQGLPRPGSGTQPATRAPAGTSGKDGLPGLQPQLCRFQPGRHLRLSRLYRERR